MTIIFNREDIEKLKTLIPQAIIDRANREVPDKIQRNNSADYKHMLKMAELFPAQLDASGPLLRYDQIVKFESESDPVKTALTTAVSKLALLELGWGGNPAVMAKHLYGAICDSALDILVGEKRSAGLDI